MGSRLGSGSVSRAQSASDRIARPDAKRRAAIFSISALAATTPHSILSPSSEITGPTFVHGLEVEAVLFEGPGAALE